MLWIAIPSLSEPCMGNPSGLCTEKTKVTIFNN